MHSDRRPLAKKTGLRHQNWYMRGWEYRETDGKKTLVYTREYYRLLADEATTRRQKVLVCILYAVLCGVYIGFECTLCQGGLMWYAGAPCLLAVIPLFYLGLGVVNFALCEEAFTFRRLHAAFFRLRIGGAGVFVLLAWGTVGQAVFLCIYGKALTLFPELVFLLGALLGTVCAGGIDYIRKQVKYEVTE